MNILILSTLIMLTTACGKVGFDQSSSSVGSLGVCAGISCDLTPLTTRPGVVTILMAIGDQVDSQLVVKAASSQLIAETVVRYASPKPSPRILVVIDAGAGSESKEDSVYVAKNLLARYDVRLITETSAGLSAADLNGYDLIWFNNPGAPMSNVRSRDALIAFKGGVIMQGDDLGYGVDFDNSALTGLKFLDNGTSVTCGGTNYAIDNNAAYQYRVSLDATKIPGANASEIGFVYGNDIDNTVPARADLEVLAQARGPVDSCSQTRPAIVRYLK